MSSLQAQIVAAVGLPPDAILRARNAWLGVRHCGCAGAEVLQGRARSCEIVC